MSDWLWHPKIKDYNELPPGPRPAPGDYRVFPCVKLRFEYASHPCCRINAPTLYKCLTILVGVVWVIGSLLIVLSVANGVPVKKVFQSDPVWSIELSLLFAVLLCSIQALRTMKPIFAQLLFPIFIALDICFIADQIVSLVQIIRKENIRKNNVVESGLFMSILGLVLIVLAAIWCFYLLYTFYTYLRDVKLHEEQMKTRANPGEEMVLNEKEIE